MKYLCYTIACNTETDYADSVQKGLFMKRKTYAVLTAAIILLTSTIAYADTGVITASNLNVRQAPNSAVIGQLTYGQNVTVIGYVDGWCKIQYDDKTGFIFGNYVSVTPDEAAAKDADAAQPTQETETTASSAGQNVVEYAKKFLGVPYVYGVSSPSGFDCSGFVQYVYKYFGISLPRTSYSQMYSGYAVSTADMQPGDIIVFRGGGHVGIYIGNDTYIHAPNSGRSVSIDPLDRSIHSVRRVF